MITRVAIGFELSGYHHVKVTLENKNKRPMPVVIEWLYLCAGGFNNGTVAILISLLRTSKYDDFCTFKQNWRHHKTR